MRYSIYTLIVSLIALSLPIASNAQQAIQSGIHAGHTEATGSGGSASGTVGQLFYNTIDGCGGRIQTGVNQPDFPLLNRQSELTATDTSDAYVTISWSLLEECFKNVDNRCLPYPDGVLVELLAGGERIYSDIVFNANGLLTDSYRHFIGPDSTVNYTLNLFIRGSGQMACTSLTATGSTLPFQPPTNFTASMGSEPGRILLDWVNNSQLSSTVLIFRKANGDSTLVASLPGTETVDTAFTFVDAFLSGDEDNLVNGVDYEYCLRTFNNQLDRLLPEAVCTNGSTFDVGLTATVQGPSTIDLDWVDVTNFADALNIRRDGVVIATLDSTATAFTDLNPTYGTPSTYRLELLNSEERILAIDTVIINLPAIGRLSGFVRTPLDVGIEGIPVTYRTLVASDTLRDTVLTDYRGFYAFEDVFFARSSVFELNPLDQGRFTFGAQALADTLSNEAPFSRLLNFTARETFPVSLNGSISVDTVRTTARIDELAFDWDFTTSGNLDDTLHFQLQREGELIDITDNQQLLELQDLSGSAGYIYKYRVVAYGFIEDSLVTGDFVVFDTMPSTEPPYDLIGTIGFDGSSDNVMTLSWNHDSENFDGFRLYRENELIAIIDTADRFFYDYYAEPGQTFEYELTAFRKAVDSTNILESLPAISGPLTIPSLPAATSLTLTPLPASNAMQLSWSLPAIAAEYDNLSGFVITRNNVPIKRVLKQGQDYVYRDYQGVPGANTAYQVQAYLSTPDTTYLGAVVAAAGVYPAIPAPAIASTSVPQDGALQVNLDPAYQQSYSNYDGYIFTANGTPFDTITAYERTAYYTPDEAAGLSGVAIEVAAYRSVAGQLFVSPAASQTANIPAQTGVPMDSISKFVASSHLPMHVALKWDFPDFIFATFSVYRDGVLLDTLPFTARNYYDYTAEPGRPYLYSIVADYEGTSSPVVSAKGVRRGDDYLHGQLLKRGYASDRNAVAVTLRDAVSGAFLQRTFSDSSGYFRFPRLHDEVGSGNWQIQVDDTGGGHALVDNTAASLGTSDRTVLFRDAFTPAAVPPLPFRDSVAFVEAFQLSPFPEEQGVVASWSLTEGGYDFVQVSRGLSTVAEISPSKSRTFFLDSLGIGNTDYPYTVNPLLDDDNMNFVERDTRTLSRVERYPVLRPVECLSALPNLDYLDNSVTIQWSHFNDKVSYYEIKRNGFPIGQVSRGDSLVYIDLTGKPDQTYIYELTAVRQNSSGTTVSDARTVTVEYPEVARPVPFSATPVPDSNAVLLEWGYNGAAVSGFRIFRDEVAIVDVPADSRSYYDYAGIPFSDPEYSIVALLDRGGMLFQSRPSRAEAAYPDLLSPANLSATRDNELGVVRLAFSYRAQGVSQFRISRQIGVGGTPEPLATISYSYDGSEQDFAYMDVTGTPNQNYIYKVEALDRRLGIEFASSPTASSATTYPLPPPVTAFTGSTQFRNWVDLAWEQDFATNVDGYRLIRDIPPLDTFTVINPGQRSYQDVFFPFSPLPAGNMDYSIRAYREVDGQLYFSSPRNVNGRLSNSGADSELAQVNATKGSFANRTRISWAYGGNLSTIDGFNVYRGEERIATLGADDEFYNDSDGVPGRPYVYTVYAVISGEEDAGLADVGFTQGSGQLEGKVVTIQGNAPVEGARLVARGEVEGEFFAYETETDNAGQFVIPGMYVGEGPVTYTLSVSFRDHGFLEEEQVISLSPSNSVKDNIFFFDTTAYVVTGRAAYANTNCAIDSIGVVARHILSDGSVVEENTITDQDGNYSLVLNPYLSGLEQIIVGIDSIFVRNQGQPNESRVLHRFNQPRRPVPIFPEVPQLTRFDFLDTLTYEVDIAVRNVCGFAASSNGRFDVEVSTRDGCFKRVKATELNGKVLMKLPPLDGLVARVVDAAPLSLENNLIVNYLEYRPTNLELATLHIENGGFNAAGNFVLTDPDTLIERELVYHKPATINLSTEFGERPTCDASQPRVVEQGQAYDLNFRVTENHQGINCEVTEGFLIINNAAAVEQRVVVEYDSTLNGFPTVTFEAGTPNLVFPYRKGINVQYFSAIGDLLSEFTIPVVVTGSDALPGSDIIVDPADEDGILKYPVMILRDPPGDGSYSYIEEGTTVTKTFTDVSSFRIGGGLVTELKIAAKVGVFVDASITGGGGDDVETSESITFTAQQRIETSSTSDFVGPDADVLVGVGVSTQYGITEIIEFDEASCSFRKRQQIAIAPEGIETDWLYTVAQIKQLIQEKKNDIVAVRNGTRTIVRGGEVLSELFAVELLETEIFNWEEVLRYHQVSTVPYYQFCADDFSDLEGKVPGNVIEEAAQGAQTTFCSEVQIQPIDNTLDAEDVRSIVFDASLQEKYEQSVAEVDGLFAPFAPDNFGDAPFNEIENTTFSAGVTIEKAENLSRSESVLTQSRGFFDLSIAVGVIAFADTRAGLGITEKIFKQDSKIGGIFTLNLEWGNDRFSEVTTDYTVGYVLSDDDPGDQFSVTAIKPRSSGHTPYFQLLGGRSSCPPEEGTILRDRFDISLYDLETQSTFDFQELRALDPDEPATFYVQLTNLNPFGEQRDLFVYHEAESNENGATLRLNGGILGGGNQSGQTLTFINANQPAILPLTLTRSLNNYQFDSIYVVLRPSCTDGDLFLLGERDTVTISAFFDSPCSDISIASPGDNWLISRRNPFMAGSRENLVIEIVDYDAANPNLDEVYLEYRRLGDGSGWERIPFTELEPRWPIVSRDSLESYNKANFGPGEAPIFFFTWDITEKYNEYPDGDYQIRAIASCGTDGVIQSNIIKGQIRRQTSDVFALTEPADGVWVPGDEISIRVNKEIDCNQLGDLVFELVEKETGDPVPNIGFLPCFPNDNKLVYAPSDPSLLPYDDQILQATVYNLTDEAGNRFLDTFRWEFRVIARDLFVQDTFLETTIYQDSEGSLSTVLFFNEDVGATNFTTEGLADYPWLTVSPSSGVVSAASGRPVQFTIDGENLPVGDTTAVLTFRADSDGIADQVTIKVNVLARPPYWVVDPSQYSTSVPVITNYQFTDNLGVLSRDSMDIISAWIGNEIRGVARITGTQSGQYGAYMLVYGDPEDEGSPLEFRVWDASAGIEYNGYPADSVFFEAGQIIGSFGDPEILTVNKPRDRARYIPVNGAEDDGGLTWLSFNNKEGSMLVEQQLRELKFLQNGDIIKTASSSAGYVEGVGWISVDGLDTIQAEEGYILFLNGPDDTIRVTGFDANYGPIILENGWNLIGYPLQDTVGLNTALNQLLGVSNGDFIKTVAQDPTLPGLSTNMAAQYDEMSSQWLFGTGSGMEIMRPNFAYQVRVDQNSTLFYPGYSNALMGNTGGGQQRSPSAPFSPADPSTWQVDPSQYPSNMIVTGTLHFDGVQSYDENDRVAAFVNGECRGVSPLYEVAPLNESLANLFVYGNSGGDEVQILLYDASEDQVYLHTEALVFQPNATIGAFSEPYRFENQPISAAYAVEHTYCEADTLGAIEVSFVGGLQAPYQYQWSTGQAGMRVEGLQAGEYTVTITGQAGIQLVDTVRVLNEQIPIPTPTVETDVGTRLCLGSDLVGYAVAPDAMSTVQWHDEEGNLLQDGPTLLVEDLQAGFTAYAKTLYRGCLSEGVGLEVEVYLPEAGFATAPQAGVTTETEVEFIPEQIEAANAYRWAFGDGSQSNDMQPIHQYELPGLYDISLEVSDSVGCSNSSAFSLWVETATHVLELESGKMSLEAMPNPFSQVLRVAVEVPEPGSYELVLSGMKGELLKRYTFDWSAGPQQAELDVRAPDGVYLLTLQHQNGARVVVPVVKQAIRP